MITKRSRLTATLVAAALSGLTIATAHAAAPAPGTITTAAGTGEPCAAPATSACGNGGPGAATATARLTNPNDVAVDAQGNVYIADLNDNEVRKVAPDGTTSTIAGTGAPNYGGSTGDPATGVPLDTPTSLALDKDGNLYVVDFGNSRIVEVVKGTGKVVVIMDSRDNGCYLPYGVAVDDGGHLFFSDTFTKALYRIDNPGLDDAGSCSFPTVAGGFNAPLGLSLDHANHLLFVADNGDGKVYEQKLTSGGAPDGGDSALASFGNPVSAPDSILAVATDGAGNLFVSDPGVSRVQRLTYNPATGALTGGPAPYAGNGKAGFVDNAPRLNGELNAQSGVAVDSMDNLFIADYDNNRVREVAPDNGGLPGGGTVTPELGSGELFATGLAPLAGALLYRRRARRKARKSENATAK